MAVQTLKLNRLNLSEQETLQLRQLCDGVVLFEDTVKRVMREKGLRYDKALLAARGVRGDLYDNWCKRGRPNIL